MLQQQISRKISALIDWSACYITESYPKHQQDNQTIGLFKSILMNIDPIYFKQLLLQPSTIQQLQINIHQYFKLKLHQDKQTVLQGGNQKNNPIKISIMFQLILQLSYLSTKQQCLSSISSLDDESKHTINKILQQIIKERGNKSQITSNYSSQNQTIKRLREQNRKLRVTIESLRVNQSLLIQKNLELQARFRQFEYQNLRRDSDIEEANRKIQMLEGIIKQISVEIYNDENFNNSNIEEVKNPSVLDNCKLVKSMNSQKQLNIPKEVLEDSQEQMEEVEGKDSKQCSNTSNLNDDWYVKRLESQFRNSQQIARRFNKLRQMHEKLKNDVEEILN